LICLVFQHLRRRQKEEKAPAKPTRASKRKAPEPKPKVKAPPKKKAKPAEPEPPAVDTSKDAAIAAKLADTRGSGRNRDATGAKSKKAAALAQLREVRYLHACC
jgi:hypothetical protein